MTGLSTRFAFKILVAVFNFDHRPRWPPIPVHLHVRARAADRAEQFRPRSKREVPVAFIKVGLAPRYAEFIGKEIQTAYLESYSGIRAEHLRPLRDLRRLLDPGPGVPRPEHRRDPRPRSAERGTGRSRSLRASATRRTSRNGSSTSCCARAANNGCKPAWTSYEKLRAVIEEDVLNTEDLLPVISFNAKASADEQKKHQDFVDRMIEQGSYRQAGASDSPRGTQAVRKGVLVRHGRLTASGGGLPRRTGRQERIAMSSVIDRRFDSKNKSAVNWQRFMRRYKGADPPRRSPTRSPTARSATWTAARRLDPIARHFEPTSITAVPAAGGETVHPGNGSSGPATRSSVRWAGAAAAAARRQRTGGRGRLRLHALPRRVPRHLLRRPGPAEPGQDPARPDHRNKRVRAGYTASGMPANINVVRSLRGATGRGHGAADARRQLKREAEEKLAEMLEEPSATTRNRTRRCWPCAPEIRILELPHRPFPSSTPSTCASTTASSQPKPTTRR